MRLVEPASRAAFLEPFEWRLRLCDARAGMARAVLSRKGAVKPFDFTQDVLRCRQNTC